MKQNQISAYVSEATKVALETYSRKFGIKKGRLIEDALGHHLAALCELPADVIVPARIVLSSESFERLAEMLETPPEPTPALRELMRGGD